VARIDVVEGRIGKVSVEGNKHYKTAFIQGYFKPVLQSKVAQNKEFEKALLLLNEFMDLKVTAVLQQGTEEGTTDVVLKVQDKAPFHVAVDYNNFGNRFVGQNRVGLGLFFGNLLTGGDSLNARGILAFPSKTGSPFEQIQYLAPVNTAGTKVGVTYANGATLVGRELAILDIRSKANVYGISVEHPLMRRRGGPRLDLERRLSFNIDRILLPLPRGRVASNDVVRRGAGHAQGNRQLRIRSSCGRRRRPGQGAASRALRDARPKSRRRWPWSGCPGWPARVPPGSRRGVGDADLVPAVLTGARYWICSNGDPVLEGNARMPRALRLSPPVSRLPKNRPSPTRFWPTKRFAEVVVATATWKGALSCTLRTTSVVPSSVPCCSTAVTLNP